MIFKKRKNGNKIVSSNVIKPDGPIKKVFRQLHNKYTIWKDTDKSRGYKELIRDIILYGLILNGAIWVISKGWFTFTPFTIIGWGCVAHFVYEYPKYWVEEILKRNQQ